jgi:riboflavin-specific deaminase-like protein
MTDLPDVLLPAGAAERRARSGRPFVTLSYAQSLDGCLTLRRGRSSPVSGPESMRLTHALRAAHDVLLVGVGTVLADDPRLTVRLPAGPDPQPVVLDSRLRTPLTARLLRHPRGVWIAATDRADPARAALLAGAGAQIISLPAGVDGRVDLAALLDELRRRAVGSLMVEGGGEVISSFLRCRLADRLVITVAPVLAGGYPSVQALGVESWAGLPRLRGMQTMQAGEDLIVWGDLA